MKGKSDRALNRVGGGLRGGCPSRTVRAPRHFRLLVREWGATIPRRGPPPRIPSLKGRPQRKYFFKLTLSWRHQARCGLQALIRFSYLRMYFGNVSTTQDTDRAYESDASKVQIAVLRAPRPTRQSSGAKVASRRKPAAKSISCERLGFPFAARPRELAAYGLESHTPVLFDALRL